ncbi:hypothetical protein IAT38_002127 [Cryptococcus sp. DSM 104549]
MVSPTEEDQAEFQRIAGSAGFGTSLVKSFRVHELDEVPEADAKGRRRLDGWRMSFQGVVTPDMTNLIGNLHGAAVTWLLDTCTSAAMCIVATPTFWGPPMLSGVSLSIETQYLNPAPVGTKLLIEVEIVKCSETLANQRVEIKEVGSKKIIAVGTHLKTWRAMTVKTPAKL